MIGNYIENKEESVLYPTILICGYGIVGKYIKNTFGFASIYDKYKEEYKTKSDIKYDFCFICVQTPNYTDGNQDISEIVNSLESVNADIYIIKSTVIPSTTQKLKKIYKNKNIVFSPEFSGTTQHVSDENFLIIGTSNKTLYHKIRNLYYLIKKNDFKIICVSETEAEIVKYMINSYLATKVIFCNQFKEICSLYDANYDEVRDAFILDERIGSSHTIVYDDKKGFDSKCFNKDLPALVNELRRKGFDKKILIDEADKINDEYRKY